MSVRHPIFALLLLAAARAGAQDAPTNSAITLPQNQSDPGKIVPGATAPGEADVSEPEVALDELIRLAQANNPQPQIAADNLAAAKDRAAAAGSQLNPTLQIVPGLGGNTNSRNEEVIVSQPLDLFGRRRANRRVSDAEVRRAQAEQTLANRSLIVQVKNAAADLFAAQEAESLGSAQVAIAIQFRDAAARKAQLGDAPAVQTQRAQLELDRAEVELDQARAERLSRRATLNQIIGAPPQTPLRVSLPDVGFLSFTNLGGTDSATLALPGVGSTGAVAPISGVPSVGAGANPPSLPAVPSLGSVPQPPIVGASSQVGSDLVASRASLLPGALQRPDILAAQSSAEAARAQADAIGLQRRPLIEIQARRAGVFDPSPLSLRAVITMPLFDFGSIKRQKSAALSEARAQDGQVALLRSQAAAQIESALIRLNQNRNTVGRYRSSLVPQTLDLLRKTQVGYAAGASTYLEVLEAQRAVRQVQTEYLQALVGARTGEAALESALGSGLPTSLPSSIPNSNRDSTPPTNSINPAPLPDNIPGGVVR